MSGVFLMHLFGMCTYASMGFQIISLPISSGRTASGAHLCTAMHTLYVFHRFDLLAVTMGFYAIKWGHLALLASPRSFRLNGVWKTLAAEGIEESRMRVPQSVSFADAVHEITCCVCLMNYVSRTSFATRRGLHHVAFT